MRNISLILFLLVAGIFSTKSSAQAVILKADTVEVACISTDTILVPVRLDDFTNVSGLQFTLKWDTALLQYVHVTMLHPQFHGGSGFDTLPATIEAGILTFSWTDPTGLSLPSNTVLFNVAFVRVGGPQTPVSFFNLPTAIFAFNTQFDEIPVEWFNGAVKPIDDDPPTISCPANVLATSSGAIPIPNIAPILNDNCGTPAAGWTSTGATSANFPNDPDASGALFNIGTSTVTYTAADAGSNTATCSFEVTVEFGISSTDLTLVASPNGTASCGETITFDILAFNFDSIVGLQFSMNWPASALEYISVSNVNAGLGIVMGDFNTSDAGNGLLSFAWISPTLAGQSVPDGELLFTLTFNVLGSGDLNFGNIPTASIAFTGSVSDLEEIPLVTFGAAIAVQDNIPPTITCPADVLVQSPGAVAIQGIAPTSLGDNCAAPLVGWVVSGATNGSFPNDPDASGAFFNIGSNTVVYTATDAGNNTATCSFNVTVEFAITTTDLTIVANGANATCGGTFGVDITAFNFETVAALQFTINWNPSVFQFTTVSNLNLPIGVDISNFGVDSVGVGYITFAWTSADLNGSTLNNGELLFTINFDFLGNMPSGITFGDNPTIRVAFDGGTFDEIPMTTIDGLVGVSDNQAPIIVCPQNVTVDAPQGQLFATLNGLQPISLTDNCDTNPGLSYTQSGATNGNGTGNANGNYNAGTTTVVYTATDANGNSATCSFQVVVNAEMPVILRIDTIDLGCQGAPDQVTVQITVENFTDIIGLQFGLNWDPTVLDLVLPVTIQSITAGPPPLFINQAAGTLAFFGGHPAWPDLPDGSTILIMTFNVLDATALGTTILPFVGPFDALNDNFQSVPVQTFNGAFSFTLDNEPPTVVCPSDITVNAPQGDCSADLIAPPPTATDDCGNIATIMITPVGITFQPGPTVATYTVTDDSGNSSSCSFTITVITNAPPQIVNCPTDITVDAGVNCNQVVTWADPSFVHPCMDSMTFSNNFFPNDIFPLGTTTVIYTATDLASNVVTCSFEVMVQDVTAPTIICPADTVLVPASGCEAIVFFDATIVADNCDQSPTVTCSHDSGDTFSGITTVTCAVLDAAGNLAQCSFTITVLDTIAPIFTNGCPTDITVVSASGNCGANPSWALPAVADNCDPNVSVISVPPSGTFFPVQGSPHTVVLTATDDFGNSATCTFTVTIQDLTPPVLTNCPALPIIIVLPVNKCDTVLNWTPPTVADNCGLGGVVLSSNFDPGATFTTGDTMVVYTATDASGNVSTCFFNVSIRDVVPPVILGCPTQPIVIQNGDPCGNSVSFPFPTGTDNCTPEAELVFTSAYWPNDTFKIGTTTFKVRVTDASGNFAECDIVITVLGPVPGFINVPAPPPIIGCDVAVSWISPTPVGFCPPVTIDSSHASGSIFHFGTTTVTYTATDLMGGVATATFNIVVTETVPPVIDCPASPIVLSIAGVVISDPDTFLQTVYTTPNCDGVILGFNLPNATDNCVTPIVTQTQGLPTGTVFTEGFNDLIFRAVDSAGNFVECLVRIQVLPLPGVNPVVSPLPGCQDDNVTIVATDIPGAVYTWNPGSSTTNVLSIPNLNTQTAGQYIVQANVNGCLTPADTVTVYLVTQPNAQNDLTYIINPGETITFSSVLLNDNLVPAFDFGICSFMQIPGLTMNTADGTFTYTAGDEPGMFSFSYTVCSMTCMESDEAVVTITVNDTRCSFIPNIITPNGDDTNDWLVIPCIDTRLFNENSLEVFNQWGHKVYEASPYSNDPNLAWRGTLNGEPGKDLPDGVYFYIFKPGPNIAPKKGFIEIFR